MFDPERLRHLHVGRSMVAIPDQDELDVRVLGQDQTRRLQEIGNPLLGNHPADLGDDRAVERDAVPASKLDAHLR